MAKIIVTGGAGYIGSHTILDLVATGYEPILVDDFSNSERGVVERLAELCGKPIRWHAVDCRDRDAIADVFAKEGSIGGVIHFAASKSVGESQQKPVAYYSNNIGSLLVMLDVMAEFEVQDFVFSSSCTVYGQAEQLPVTEETPVLAPASVYGATKQICEQIVRDTVASGARLRATLLRYFNPIGAHPSGRIGELPLGAPQNLVPIILQSVAGIRGPVQIFGDDWSTPDGTCIRDYIHVVDLAAAHVKCLSWMESGPDAPMLETLNIGTGQGVSVREAIAAFERATGQSVEVTLGDRRDGDIEQVYACVEKAERLLGWRAERSLEEAMQDAWRWQRSLI
ncbi:MAG: UDP-glucose 4-epimerase GalE [Myxococcales bacterium]|nr:UDP-glucose 4-epimerase GalE [Myxococcales bacterium]HIL81117.1 UDP-glucose 4-epimerase GalE [Myxococcales bacterium]